MPVEAGNNVWRSAQLRHKEIVLEARMNNPRLHSGLHSDIGNLLGVEMKSFFSSAAISSNAFLPLLERPARACDFDQNETPNLAPNTQIGRASGRERVWPYV